MRAQTDISIDCPLLAKFYAGARLKGEWTNSSGWNTSSVSDTTSTVGDCCKWAGVTCGYPKRYVGLATPWVEHLNLTNNGLTGHISIHTSGLKRLKTLDLSKNKLKGGIDPLMELNGEFRCEDTESQSVTDDQMYHRSCSKDFECKGGKCLYFPGLSEIWLQDNLLSGTIPHTIGKLHKTLQILDMSINKISGTLPPALGVVREMRELNLYFNRLVGPIPAEMGLMRKMRFLHLGVNHLSGTIPVQLANMARLEQLDLSLNQFTGRLIAVCCFVCCFV